MGIQDDSPADLLDQPSHQAQSTPLAVSLLMEPRATVENHHGGHGIVVSRSAHCHTDPADAIRESMILAVRDEFGGVNSLCRHRVEIE